MPQPQHPSRAHSEAKHAALQSRTGLASFHDSLTESAPIDEIVDQPNMRGKRWVGRSGGQLGVLPRVGGFFIEQENYVFSASEFPPGGDVGPFSFNMVAGKLFFTGYSIPAYNIRLDTPTTNLANHTTVTYALSGAIQSVYSATKDRIYTTFQDVGTNLWVDELNPTTLAHALVLNDPTIPQNEGGLCVDAASLYVVTNQSSPNARVHKYDLATFGVHTSSIAGALSPQISQANCIVESAGKLFVCGAGTDGVARLDATTLAVEQKVSTVSIQNAFDDAATDGTYLYVPSFTGPLLTRLLKTDLTSRTTLNLGHIGGNGIIINGTRAYVTMDGAPGYVARIDLNTFTAEVQQLPYGSPSEITYSAGFYYIGFATTPSRIVRYTEAG